MVKKTDSTNDSDAKVYVAQKVLAVGNVVYALPGALVSAEAVAENGWEDHVQEINDPYRGRNLPTAKVTSIPLDTDGNPVMGQTTPTAVTATNVK